MPDEDVTTAIRGARVNRILFPLFFFFYEGNTKACSHKLGGRSRKKNNVYFFFRKFIKISSTARVRIIFESPSYMRVLELTPSTILYPK